MKARAEAPVTSQMTRNVGRPMPTASGVCVWTADYVGGDTEWRVGDLGFGASPWCANSVTPITRFI